MPQDIRNSAGSDQVAPDVERMTDLLESIMIPVRDNYARGPISRDRCYEALNALAAAAAVVLHGCDGLRGKARSYFDHALEVQFPSEGGHE